MNKETFESYIAYRKILSRYMWIRYLLVAIYLIGSALSYIDGDILFAFIIGAACIYGIICLCIKWMKIEEIDRRFESVLELSMKDDWRKFHVRKKE